MTAGIILLWSMLPSVVGAQPALVRFVDDAVLELTLREKADPGVAPEEAKVMIVNGSPAVVDVKLIIGDLRTVDVTPSELSMNPGTTAQVTVKPLVAGAGSLVLVGSEGSVAARRILVKENAARVLYPSMLQLRGRHLVPGFRATVSSRAEIDAPKLPQGRVGLLSGPAPQQP